MNQSTRLRLNLPEGSDKFDIDDLNENFEKLDDAVLLDEDGDISLYDNTSQQSRLRSALSADNNGSINLSRERYINGSLVKATGLNLYEDDETQEQVAELYADDKIDLTVGTSSLEISEEGVFFNGKKLGGGGASAGQAIGILTGTASSVYGIAQEVTE